MKSSGKELFKCPPGSTSTFPSLYCSSTALMSRSVCLTTDLKILDNNRLRAAQNLERICSLHNHIVLVWLTPSPPGFTQNNRFQQLKSNASPLPAITSVVPAPLTKSAVCSCCVYTWVLRTAPADRAR